MNEAVTVFRMLGHCKCTVQINGEESAYKKVLVRAVRLTTQLMSKRDLPCHQTGRCRLHLASVLYGRSVRVPAGRVRVLDDSD